MRRRPPGPSRDGGVASIDHTHAALGAAVEAFVRAGRTADAYGQLARSVLALRPAMDRSVREEAELDLTVLALGPIQATVAGDGEHLRVVPIAITNPIFIDRDGDGAFSRASNGSAAPRQ